MAELGKLSGTRFDGMIVRLFAPQLKLEKASSFGGSAWMISCLRPVPSERTRDGLTGN